MIIAGLVLTLVTVPQDKSPLQKTSRPSCSARVKPAIAPARLHPCLS